MKPSCPTLRGINNAKFLAFGWGCLVWQPLALQYGKRPVYLLSMLATMVITPISPIKASQAEILRLLGHPNLGSLRENKQYVDSKQDTAGVFWSSYRITM